MSFFALALALACRPVRAFAQDVKVNWATPAHDQVNIAVEGDDDLRKECVNSGFEVQYRFKIQLCLGRSWWFDSCGRRRTITHAISYDPIGDTFKIVSDLFGDEAQPDVWQGTEEREAVALFSKVKAFP